MRDGSSPDQEKRIIAGRALIKERERKKKNGIYLSYLKRRMLGYREEMKAMKVQ